MDTEWTQIFHCTINRKKGKMKQKETIIKEYPTITDLLIEVLEQDFPDKLPREYKDNYELGVLIGQQQVIDKLKFEKDCQENRLHE